MGVVASISRKSKGEVREIARGVKIVIFKDFTLQDAVQSTGRVLAC